MPHSNKWVHSLCAGLSLLMLAPSCPAQEQTLESFKLKDQFDREFSQVDYAGRIVIVVGSDREGSPFNGLWAKAIRDSLEMTTGLEQIAFIAVADLRGVPFFLKSFIKSKFPVEKDSGVLMDWKGFFPTTYSFEEKYSNILIFDREGQFVLRVFGREVKVDKLARILDAVQAIH